MKQDRATLRASGHMSCFYWKWIACLGRYRRLTARGGRLRLDLGRLHRLKSPFKLRRWSPELVVFTLAVATAIALLTVPLPVDPMIYLEAAQNPGAADPNHWTTRIGLVLPVWVVSLAFGYSEVTLYTIPILATAVLAAATAMAGRRFFNTGVGLGAGILVLASPFVLPFATQLLPDVGSAALVTLAFALVAGAATKAEPNGRGARADLIVASGEPPAWAVGLLVGFSYLVRETGLLYLPALIVFTAVLGLGLRFIARMLAWAMAVAFAEAAMGAFLWGDPLARVHSVLGRTTAPLQPSRAGASEAAFALQSDFFSSASVFVNLLWDSNYGRFVLVMGVLLLVGALVRRSRRYLALLAWIAIPWAIFAVVGSIRPESGRVIIRLALDRYWATLIPPFLIGGLGVLSEIVGQVRPPLFRKLSTAAVVLLIGLAAVAGVAFSFERRHDYFIRLGNDHYWQLRESLAGITGEPTIAVPHRPADLIRLYTNDPLGRSVFTGTIKAADLANDPPPEWVVLDFVHGGPSAPAPALMSRESGYRVYDAERNLKWALLTTAVDGHTHFAGEVVQGQVPDDRWMARRVVGSTWGGVGELPVGGVEVAQGDTLVVFDDTADYGFAPEEPTMVIPRGSVVSVHADVTLDDGRLRVVCDFFDVHEPSGSIRIVASTVLARESTEDSVFAMCRAPDTGSEYALRLTVLVTGPAELRMGVARISSYSPK